MVKTENSKQPLINYLLYPFYKNCMAKNKRMKYYFTLVSSILLKKFDPKS